VELLKPFITTIFSTIVLVSGFIFTFGRLKEKIMTKDDCSEKRDVCGEGVSKKMKNYDGKVVKKIDDLKILVIELHEKQSKRIEDMDNKREQAKDIQNEEMKKLHQTIGQIKGLVQRTREELV